MWGTPCAAWHVPVSVSLAMTGYGLVPTAAQVLMTGNQEPKAVDITQAAIDAGPEVFGWRREGGGGRRTVGQGGGEEGVRCRA